ncbi:hypothetical protein GGS24DRAFT_494591 [Hypoxylon argillaceum]|nr:hypothetical protein GGS24DRAFT_494591 [Hypoxylon argillaceum]
MKGYAISAYSFASCGWNALQAAPLIRELCLLLPSNSRPSLTPSPLTILKFPIYKSPGGGDIEHYLARSLGFALLALGLVTVVLTGSLPVGSVIDTAEDVPSPYAAPVLLLTTLHHAASAFQGWARYTATDQAGYLLGFVGSAGLAAFGTWCLLFGGEKARISRRTGADKRTSGFPFRNAEADRRKVR